MKLNRTITTVLLVTALSFLYPFQAEGQVFSKKKIKRENAELKAEVNSLKSALDSLKRDSQMKDSVANEMMGIFRENEDKSAAGLNPEDYNAEVTDSLLNIWYLHRQINDTNEGAGYDMDSIHFSSNVPDSVFRNRLEKMNSYITLPYNETVRNFIILYTEKMPTKMGNILGLCQYYMPIFEDTFNQYNLPDELKYVAIIESALNPVAVSRAGAKGMWQFMLKTAKSYGLEINTFVDERLDPFKSADAAARYLTDSYKLFGDWNLAISSYNCGPGNVNKAIRRSGSRDFWSVYDYLPRETRGYVPAFVGAMYAVKYSKENGLVANNVQMPAQIDTFEIHRNLHFQQISDLVGIPMDEIRNLNPQYIKDIIPGNSKTYVLRLPYNYASNFIANEDSIYTYKAAELFNPQTLTESKSSVQSGSQSESRIRYTVRSGDYLGKVASKYNVSVNQLKQWNHLRSNTLQVGQKLYIYRGGGSAAPAERTSVSSSSSSSRASADSGTASSNSFTTYTVKSGDTLFKIAQKYPGVSADAIMKFNGIGSSIRPGMKIKIPDKES